MNKVYRLAAVLTLLAVPAVPAHAALTVTPITWNILGLDSNSPATGPHLFPVGARVCSDVATTNVGVNFVFDTANANINLRAGSLTSINIPSIGAGQCSDAYFEVDITQTAAAFDTTRRYHITATDGSGTASTPTPREIYVEHLVSQSRNSITDVKFGPVGGPYTSVPAGGSMNLAVGNTYDIQQFGGTATQGYNQFEAFIHFPNTIFQVLNVVTTYSADDSPYVPNPNNKLYADACLWQNDPNSPAYRSCGGGDFKAGGSNVVTTYTIKIVSGGGTSQSLGSLLYDFSGSSYHYNADFGISARIANIIDPTTANISKSFSPSTTSVNGVSALTITLTNPNGGALSGYNFTDNLPANLVIATPNGATTSGCGTPTLTATAGSSSITFANGTVAANGTCVIKVNVTPATTGSKVNTTNNLFIDTTDTTHSASATLTVNSAPPPGTGLCGQTLALWDFPTGFTASNPAPTTANVTASAAPGAGVNAIVTSHDSTINPASGTVSWGSNGAINGGATLDTSQNDYFEFAINTTGISALTLSFDAEFRAANGPTGVAVYYGTTNTRPETGTQITSSATALSAQNTWVHFGPFNISSGLNASGNTYFRIYFFNAGNQNSGSDGEVDHVLFSGCSPATQPTIAKAFSPNPIAVNGISTLTFTLTNTNTAPLTGAAFTDALPSGVQVAATPAAATTCGGTWAPAAGNTSLTFSGGTIPSSSSCTVSVNVTATTSGPHTNVSGFLSTTESGTNPNSIATASLTALVPPSIAKLFAPNPILPGATSTLTFTITNPNPNDALGGVAFGDTFPTSPAAMVVAATPGATTSACGSPVFSPAAGAGSISFSGGTIAAGGTCSVSVNVTAPTAGTYNNTSGNVSTIINAQTINGNTASASLTVNPPSPSIHLLKQIGSTASGPWGPFLAVTTGASVFYRFTVENTGDVALLSPALTDNAVNVATCNATWSGMTLPVAVPANDNHIVTCVVGPVTASSGSHTNTASVSATFNGNPVTSPNSSATYATTALTLAKSVTESTFTLPGDLLHYSYLVTNSGFAPLSGPVTVSDDKTTVTCPAVTTVGDLDAYLDPGESVTCTATYTITGTDVTNAAVTNTAQASADSVNSNQASKTVPLSTSADVSIVKTLTTTGPFYASQTINYTLTVANGGPSTATSIQVTDSSTNLTITNVTGGGCSSLPCTIASLASGSNVQIFVTATINAAGAFDNSASATAAQPDPNPSNNTDNSGNGGTATNAVDIAVVKTFVTAGPYRHGDVIQFNLAVTNNGPSTATNVVVVDQPTGLTITAMSGGTCTGASPSLVPNASVQCTIASLAASQTQNVTVTATINASGPFSNSGSVSATETDTNTNNNSSSVNDVATTSANVGIVKAITTTGPYFLGETITYTLTVTNAGPSTASNVVVTDTPSNMTIQSVSVSGGNPCASFPCTMSPAMIAGNTRTITVTATIDATGAFSNTATANGSDFDPDTSNNTSTVGGTAVAAADVSIVKTLTTSGPFNAGQSVTYTLVVANAGPSTATTIQVTDTPTNLTITNVSGSGCSALPCTIASLASGANTAITVTATINAAGAFDNAASVTATELDPNLTNNTDNSGNGGSTGAAADVSIVKTLTTAGPYASGQTIAYTLLVANGGPSTATSVQVTDTPTNLTITGVSGGGCSALPCTIASLASGANVTINVTATINATGAFDNVASANATEFDPNTTNNTDSSGNGGTASAPAVDLAINKTASVTTLVVGQAFDYTLTITNNGPGTATGVVVTDTLPTAFSLLTATSTQGTCSGTTTVTCTIGTMLNGATVTVTLHGTATAPGTLQNTATVAANEAESVTTNNSSLAAILVVSGAGAPTLDEYGLLLLILALAMTGAAITTRMK